MVRPVTPVRFGDLLELFGPKGACAGCFCMWPRLTAAEFQRGKGEPNRRRLERLVDSGEPPGLIAYLGKEAVGWIALAPRQEYVRLERSRVLARVDDKPVWSVVCFFVKRTHRGKGVSGALLAAAIEHARRRGARILEGYPILVKKRRTPDAFAWFGLVAPFKRAGFEEVARRSETRPIMRFELVRAQRDKALKREAGPTRSRAPGRIT